MQRIGKVIITACFVSGLIVAVAGAQMPGGMGPGMGKGGKCGMGMTGMGPGCGMGMGMGMWDGAHAQYIIDALGLDDAKANEIKSLLQQLQKEMIKKRAEIQVAEVELKEILGKDSVDIKAAETKVKQIAALKTDAVMMHIQGIEDVKTKLTPEQKKKLTDMMQMRGMGHGKPPMDCPMMKGQNMKGDANTEPAPAKSKPRKSTSQTSTP
jgi:Spy/CpxP family protein refolding chaperone